MKEETAVKERWDTEPGDLYDNPEGKSMHCDACTILVCSLSSKKFEGREMWNCLSLWWDRAGFRAGHNGETYTRLTIKELKEMKYVGNVYDAINEKFGKLTGTVSLGEVCKRDEAKRNSNDA